ncbi:hypothetical protein [Enterobacter cloacae]|uniref:hypothetical protein n=1 Tax=Enterobacter cloacae TaxID=550 RepID=UPI002FFAB0A1
MSSAISPTVNNIVQTYDFSEGIKSYCKTGRSPFLGSIKQLKNDSRAQYIKNSDKVTCAKQNVVDEARKYLSTDILKEELGQNSEEIKMLLGIIRSCLPEGSEDYTKFNDICQNLIAAIRKEKKVNEAAKPLIALFSKHIKDGGMQLFNTFVNSSKEAWYVYHTDKGIDVSNKPTFNTEFDAIKKAVEDLTEEMKSPNLTWESLCQHGRFLINDIAAVSKTLIYYDAEPLASSPADIQSPAVNPPNAGDKPHLSNAATPEDRRVTVNVTSKGGTIHNTMRPDGKAGEDIAAMLREIRKFDIAEHHKVDLSKLALLRGQGFLKNIESVTSKSSGKDVDVDNPAPASKHRHPVSDAVGSTTRLKGLDNGNDLPPHKFTHTHFLSTAGERNIHSLRDWQSSGSTRTTMNIRKGEDELDAPEALRPVKPEAREKGSGRMSEKRITEVNAPRLPESPLPQDPGHPYEGKVLSRSVNYYIHKNDMEIVDKELQDKLQVLADSLVDSSDFMRYREREGFETVAPSTSEMINYRLLATSTKHFATPPEVRAISFTEKY